MNDALETPAAEPQQPERDQDGVSSRANHLRAFEICRRLDISDETWRRWVKSGQAPAPVPLPGVARWRVRDIEAFERGLSRREGRRTYFGSARRRGR